MSMDFMGNASGRPGEAAARLGSILRRQGIGVNVYGACRNQSLLALATQLVIFYNCVWRPAPTLRMWRDDTHLQNAVAAWLAWPSEDAAQMLVDGLYPQVIAISAPASAIPHGRR